MTLLRRRSCEAPMRTTPRPVPATRRVLVAGGAGALGAAVLEELLASRRYAQVVVAVTQPLNVTVRGLATRAARRAGPAARGARGHRHRGVRPCAPRQRPRGRVLRPSPADLPALAGRLRKRGVRDSCVVMPHAPATLPEALKHGLATLTSTRWPRWASSTC
jgi:NAD(P)-dependent dehydrogenase (short-subunit alcohol dehydrogenase family)